MTWPIHEKIQRLLKERKHRKKDLAAALGIAPQTMTDICKGRSAVTLSHLRGLVRFFGIRADFWLADSRENPSPSDHLERVRDDDLRQLEALGILGTDSWRRSLARVQGCVTRHREAWEREFGPMTAEDAALLGLQTADNQTAGSVASEQPAASPGS